MALTQVSTGMIEDAAVTAAKLGGDVNLGLATGEILTSIASSKTGYLLCNGAAYTRTSYATLAAAIGTPLSPVNTLGNALATSTGSYIAESNGLLFKNGSAASTTAIVANGIQTSTDGITWTMRTGLNSLTNSLNQQVASFGNSVYVVLTTYATTTALYYQTTPDGVTYTARTIAIPNPSNSVLASVAFGGISNRHVMIYVFNPQSGCAQVSSNVRIIYSTDGITWTTSETNTLTSASSGYQYYDVAGYSGGFVYIAYRNDIVNLIKHSVDGATWTDITSNVNSVAAINGAVKSVSYVNGRFILMTSNGQIYTSTTGATGTWSQLVAQNPIYTQKIRGNSTAYVTTNTGNTNYGIPLNSVLSTDAINWITVPNLGLGNIYITATPSTGTKFYGSQSNGAGAYYVDAYNYTTATQFVVPKINTYASNSQSSPYSTNSIPVNYLIKT